MKLFFSNSAKQEYDILKADAPEIAGKVKLILKETVAHPETGSGAPTKLEGAYSGLWQRTYSPGQVIIYSFGVDTVTVVSIGAREVALKKVELESYSAKDEKSVMEQMAANRGKDGEPKVGIFWYNRATNQLFGVVSHRVSDYTRANASDGRITCSEMHEDVWKKEFRIQKYQHGGQGPFIGAYQDKPRGRVFYHIDDGTYEVAVGKWIEEYPQAYELILEEFNLPPEKTKAKYAFHWDIGQSWR
ncbi:MAG: type II toxin-antitoxin system YoeB family toxin [Bacteroidales bacterium]|nr:type II toxin-antitoxin system YoeB family toxin [Bacteroidales bacterium]